MLVLCLALAGLPLQAVVAADLAFCLPDQHAHTHGGAHDHASPGADQSNAPAPVAADEEVPCHHCSAAALAALPPQMTAATVADHCSGPAPHLFLFFPEQPQRPPLA